MRELQKRLLREEKEKKRAARMAKELERKAKEEVQHTHPHTRCTVNHQRVGWRRMHVMSNHLGCVTCVGCVQALRLAEQRRIELKKAAVEIRQMSNEDELAFFLRV